ncbi:hypothetical protein EOD39_15542 [Acipenser ruthenus]|uniref:Uncharacterized protein n=1 Tax=Acipenser ruthenus TaxID=7906 RepID=A0A444V7Z5_ACIRT|nr:hypothetical protein EOD39_15542 [Acipenser ruthenus]
MPVGDIVDDSLKAHVLLIAKHVNGLIKMFPGIREEAIPIVIVIERNTFSYDVGEVWKQAERLASVTLGVRLHVYSDRKGVIGRLTDVNKTKDVLHAAAAINKDMVGRLSTTLSFGDVVKTMFSMTRNKIQRIVEGRTLSADLKHLPTMADGAASGDGIQMKAFLQRYAPYPVETDIHPDCFKRGLEMLHKLCDQLRRVTVDFTKKTPTVNTGGKKRKRGLYLKDDTFSAFIIALSTVLELQNKSVTVRTVWDV